VRKPLAKTAYSLITAVRGENVRRHFREYLNTQRLSGEELENYQIRRLQKQIKWACARVPFYRNLCRCGGLNPDNIRSLGDLDKLPIISKKQIQKEPASFGAEGFRGRLYTETTGGSLGEPLALLKDAENVARKRAAAWRFYSWYGIEFGDKQARFWGVPFESKLKRREKFKDLLGNRIRLNAFEISDSAFYRFYEKVRSTRVDYLYGYASTISEFAEFILTKGLENPFPDLKVSILTAETVYDAQRGAVEKAFCAPTAIEYGCGEVGIVAFECPENNLHINADNVILEIIDGSTVVTELYAKAMPLIRYRLGDSAAISETECSCGCGFPTLEYVAGREGDMIEVDGKKVHYEILNYIFRDISALKGHIRRFQVTQNRSENALTVYVEPAGAFPAEGCENIERIIREYIGFSGDVTIRVTDGIQPDPSGKLRHFIRE
jgi:phenylacetate-CoA ligase